MSDFELAPVSLNRLSEGLQNMTRFTHVAYCSGPSQLAYLISAFHVCGVSPRSCTVFAFTASAKNDELRKMLVKACSHMGMEIADPACLPAPSLNKARILRMNPGQAKNYAFWYCRGGPGTGFVMSHLQKILPDIVFEYYDGFRSPIVALEQEKSRLSLSAVKCIDDLRQLVVQRLLRPEGYFMPDDGLWQKYAPQDVERRTSYMPTEVTRDKIGLVGRILDEIDGREKTLKDSPGVVMLTGMFSERLKSVSLVDELSLYDDMLGNVRSVSSTIPILIKAHPRTSPEKMRCLEDISARYNAVLHTGQQLVEYILEKSDRHDAIVIGPPSTALLSTIQFGYGRAFCPSQRLMASYIGHEYADHHWMGRDHELMEIARVNMVNSLQELRDLLGEKKAP